MRRAKRQESGRGRARRVLGGRAWCSWFECWPFLSSLAQNAGRPLGSRFPPFGPLPPTDQAWRAQCNAGSIRAFSGKKATKTYGEAEAERELLVQLVLEGKVGRARRRVEELELVVLARQEGDPRARGGLAVRHDFVRRIVGWRGEWRRGMARRRCFKRRAAAAAADGDFWGCVFFLQMQCSLSCRSRSLSQCCSE